MIVINIPKTTTIFAMSTKELMFYTEEDVLAVLKHFGRTKKSLEEDVKMIQNWLQTQPHIPEVTDAEVVKRFLFLNKFSIERTKQKLDNYYSIRNFARQLYFRHPLSPEMLEGYKVWYGVTLPHLVGLHRVLVCKLIDGNPENFIPQLFYNHIMNFSEIRLLHDCSISDIVVADLSNTKVTHLLKHQPSLLHKIQTVVEKVYSMRVKAIHVINGFEAILSLIRLALKPKLRDRIYVHRSYGSLYEYVPKKILPKDLGGDGKSLKELSEIQLKCFEEMKERFDVLVTIKSNEELRPGKPVNDEFFGFYGNFRSIDVD